MVGGRGFLRWAVLSITRGPDGAFVVVLLLPQCADATTHIQARLTVDRYPSGLKEPGASASISRTRQFEVCVLVGKSGVFHLAMAVVSLERKNGVGMAGEMNVCRCTSRKTAMYNDDTARGAQPGSGSGSGSGTCSLGLRRTCGRAMFQQQAGTVGRYLLT